MRKFTLALVFIVLTLWGCSTNGNSAVRSAVEVEMVNDSRQDMEKTEARFGVHVCKWGVVVSKSSASFMNFPYPITEYAELRWEVAGRQELRRIDLREFYRSGVSGRLTFTFFGDRIDVAFREKR